MKNIMIILLVACTPALVFSQSRTSIAVMDYMPLENISLSESEQISEIIRSEIVKSDFINIIESSQLSKIQKEISFQKAVISSSRLLSIGKIIRADYFLLGTVSRYDDEIIITSRMISSNTGENIHAKNLFTTQKKLLKDLPEYSDALSALILVSTLGNTLENIQRLVKMNEYEYADARLRHFIKIKGNNSNTHKLKSEIDTGLIILYRKLAKANLKQNNIREAYDYGHRALLIKPEDTDSRSLYSKILVHYDSFKKEEYENLLDQCEREMKQKNFSRARKLLDQYYSSETGKYITSEYFTLYEKINIGMAEKQYHDAKELSFIPYNVFIQGVGKYEYVHYTAQLGQAKNKILDAIENNPEKNKYPALLVKIENKISRLRNEYLETMSLSSTFAPGERRNWHLSVSSRFMSNSINDESPISVNGVYPGFNFDLTYNFKIEEYISGMILTGAGINFGEEAHYSGMDKYYSSLIYSDILLSVLAGISFNSIGLYAGPVIHTGLIYRESKYENTNDDIIDPSYSATAGAGIELRAYWYIQKGIFKGIFFLSDFQIVPTLAFGQPDKRYNFFSIGAGYEF